MSTLSRVRDFLLLRDLPANRPLPSAPSEVRTAYGSLPPSWSTGKAQWPQQNIPTFINDGYGKVVTVFRGVMHVSNAIASAPLRVYLDTGGGQREEQEDHPLRRLMLRPNYLMSGTSLMAFIGIMLNVAGFCVLEKDRSEAGRVVGLWPLRSDWLKAIPRAYAPPDWEIRVPGHDPHILDARDVIVLTYSDHPNIYTTYTGLGPLSVILREVGIDNVMTDFLKVFFDSGAMPRYALIPRDKDVEYSQAEADAIKANWMQRYGGLMRSVEPAFLAGIEDVKEIGFDLNEMAYEGLRNLTDARICMGLGVPPILVGAPIGLERATYSNYEQARTAFYQDTVQPLWARIDDALTHNLLPDFEDRPGYELGFDTSDVPALQADVTPTWTRSGAAIAQGWATVNDGRREVGLPPVVGGDVFLRSLVTVEVPAVAEQKQRSNGHAIDVQVREIKPAALGAGALYRLPMERRATLASAAKATIQRLGERFAPILQTFFKEQGERVTAEATRSSAREDGVSSKVQRWRYWSEWHVVARDDPNSTETPEQIADHATRDVAAIQWSEEEDLLREVMQKLHITAGEAAALSVSELTGIAIAFDVSNPFVREVLRELAKRIVGINETTRDQVRKIVGDALDEGVSIDQLADRLRGLFNETYVSRSMSISRTESMVSYNKATVLGYQQSGVVGMVEMADSTTHCEDYGASDGLSCCDRNGLITSLDQADRHIQAEHPMGSLCLLPVLSGPALGEE